MVTRPSTIYTVSFLLRCLNGDSQSGVELYFAEGFFGRVSCEDAGKSYFIRKSGLTFKSTASGVRSFEARFLNPSGPKYSYYYALDFQARKLET